MGYRLRWPVPRWTCGHLVDDAEPDGTHRWCQTCSVSSTDRVCWVCGGPMVEMGSGVKLYPSCTVDEARAFQLRLRGLA